MKGKVYMTQSQSTYIYRVQSSVWRLPNYWPPTPSPPQRVCPPPHQRHTRRAVRGWGFNISEDARHWIGLLQYNPSTDTVHTSWHTAADIENPCSSRKMTTVLVSRTCPFYISAKPLFYSWARDEQKNVLANSALCIFRFFRWFFSCRTGDIIHT